MVASGGLLIAFGLLMAGSTTISASLHDNGHGQMWAGLVKHVMFLAGGLALLWIGLKLPPRAYRMLAYPAMAVAILALLAVLAPGVGVAVNDAQRWIDIGPIQLQPSEFGKLAILLWGADLLARKRALGTLTRARHVLIPLVPGFVIMCGLVMLEPDLGTTLCYVLILMALLWTIGLPLRYFVAMALAVSGGVALLGISASYRMARLTSFLDPFSDAQGNGYHAVQGLYALSSGGLFGVGLGQGTSKYGWVPNSSTDYVFSVIGEELGLLGCATVLVLFGVLAYSMLRLAHRTADPFVTLVAGASAVWISGQALINIGYVTAVLPVTGIPLPFISAGGTSLMLMCGVLGMLLSFARHEPDAVTASRIAAADGRRPLAERVLGLRTPKPYVQPIRAAAKTRASGSGAPRAAAPRAAAPGSAPQRAAPQRAGKTRPSAPPSPTPAAPGRPAPPRRRTSPASAAARRQAS